MQATQMLIDQLANFDTPTVINAVEALGLVETYGHYMDGSIRCLTPTLPPLVGQAITIGLDVSSPGPGHEDDYTRLLEALDASALSRVVVVEADGPERLKECVLGDGMAKTMKSLGAVGLVTNGGARDIGGIEREGFTVFGWGLVVHHASLKWHDYARAVNLGGLRVETDDLLHGDINGCVRVPPTCFPFIVQACQETAAFEIDVHLAMRDTSLSVPQKMEARATHVDRFRRRMAELAGSRE